MTQKTKTNIYQVLGIIGGLVAVYFGFQFLYALGHVFGWIFFGVVLLIALAVAFGINPFAKKTPKTIDPLLLDNLPSTTKPVQYDNVSVVDHSLNSGQDGI